MKSIQDHLTWAVELFRQNQIDNGALDARVLLGSAGGFSKEEMIRSPEKELSLDASNQFQQWVKKRVGNIPTAYLIQQKEFYSLNFFVNENVLIPRPETEILIDVFTKKIGNVEKKVCDVGTGSGIIAITLKKQFPQLQVTAMDISSEALDVAKKNADTHHVRVEWVQSNLFENASGKWHIVVANLPYIPTRDISGLSQEVQREPYNALDGGPDGLDIYRRMLDQIDDHLLPDGEVMLEFGMGQTDALISLFQTKGFLNINITKDHAGINRILYAKKE